MNADFESLEKKYNEAINSKNFEQLCDSISRCNKIYIIGNGGLHYVGSHMATDMSRLMPGTVAKSFDSFGFITSSANDFGWDNIFVRWLETSSILDDPKKTLVYGMSCSGNSTNVVKALKYSKDTLGFEIFLYGGRPCTDSEIRKKQLCIDAEYYHTVETVGLMLFYQIIHRAGFACPLINR